MSGLTEEIRAWHIGTAKIATILFIASITFSLFVVVLAEMEGNAVTPEDAGLFVLIGGLLGAVVVSVASREVRKTKGCLKWECGGSMVKILATGKYVCQVCGSEVDMEASDQSRASRSQKPSSG